MTTGLISYSILERQRHSPWMQNTADEKSSSMWDEITLDSDLWDPENKEIWCIIWLQLFCPSIVAWVMIGSLKAESPLVIGTNMVIKYKDKNVWWHFIKSESSRKLTYWIQILSNPTCQTYKYLKPKDFHLAFVVWEAGNSVWWQLMLSTATTWKWGEWEKWEDTKMLIKAHLTYYKKLAPNTGGPDSEQLISLEYWLYDMLYSLTVKFSKSSL